MHPMNLEDIRARIHRLEKLIMGLGQKESHWRTYSAPVLADERDEYRDAIYGALRSLELARMALVKLTYRLEKEAAGRVASGS
jgi:hypothetical protein